MKKYTTRSELIEYARLLYGGDAEIAPCPFTDDEIAELATTGEMLVYLPSRLTADDLAERWNIEMNVALEREKLIRSVMISEDQWFITSASARPELLYHSGQAAKRIFEDEGLHGMDLRRYLAFAATFRLCNGHLPDLTYWTFLLSGSYDRSGVSVVGFDKYGVLSHHGWMKNFKAKFAGSRYIVIAPRIEITDETRYLDRARRGERSRRGLEAALD